MGGKKTCKVEATLMIKNDENKKVFERKFSHVFYSKRTEYGCVSCPLVLVCVLVHFHFHFNLVSSVLAAFQIGQLRWCEMMIELELSVQNSRRNDKSTRGHETAHRFHDFIEFDALEKKGLITQQVYGAREYPKTKSYKHLAEQLSYLLDRNFFLNIQET